MQKCLNKVYPVH